MKPGFVDTPEFSFIDMMKAVFFFLEKKRTAYTFYSILLIGVSFYGLFPIFIIGKIVDFFTQYTGGSLNTFYLYVAILFIVHSCVSLIRLSCKRALNNIQASVAYITKVKGFEHLLDLSLKWHDKENTGNKVQRIQNGIEMLSELQNRLSNDVFTTGSTIIGTTIAFLFIKPIFFLYCIVYFTIFMSIQISFYRKLLKMNYEYGLLLENASGTYYEGLSNILTLKTLGVKNDFKKNIMSREELSRDYSIKMSNVGNTKWKTFQIINGVALAGVLILAGHQYLVGGVTIGSIFIIFNYFHQLSNAAGESTNVLERMIKIKVGIARMMPIFYDKATDNLGTKKFPKTWEYIRIQDGSFSYPKRINMDGSEESPRGLHGITLSIKKNEKIGIVGASGSGKSTFAKVFLGLYTFDKGIFSIGDVPFADISHEEITNSIALVLQDSEMFNLSLKDNITLMRNFDQELFDKAITIAQLTDLIQSLPEGMNTMIGEKGYRLSGGERQRIGIARAVYKDPQILVLDEATSSLDTKTETLIQQALEEKLEKKTIISIAHRISTLKNVDKIVVFDKGVISEEGGFEELSQNRNSKFFEIYQFQQKHTQS